MKATIKFKKTVTLVSVTTLAVLGLATSLTSNTTAVQADTTQQGQQERAFNVYSRGDLVPSGSAADGLTLQSNNTITSGSLTLSYDAATVGTAINEDTQYVVQVPEELQPLVNSADFTQYISGTYQFTGADGSVEQHTYTQDEIHVLDNGATLAFDNPEITHLVGASFDIDISLDLGQAVMDTGMRIANSQSDTNYHFLSAIISDPSAIDWTLIGNYNAGTDLLTDKLDPGYDLIQVKPTIEEPVYDAATEISGTGTPGAAIEVTVNDEVIGTGTVNVSGIYHVTIPRQSSGIIISVTQNTGVGKSEATTAVVQHETADIPAPFVTNFYDNDTVLSGAGTTAGNQIVVLDADDNQIGSGYVGPNLNFDIEVPSQKAFDILYAYETNGIDRSPNRTVIVRPATK